MIGVVGPPADAADVAAAIGGDEVVTGGARRVLDAGPALVVAIGDPAAAALVRAGVGVPVLPVATGAGLDPVTRDRAPAAVKRFLTGDASTSRRAVFDVALDGEPVARGLLDAMLVTSEPARISEYAVETADGRVRFRADGVVVATPAGSHGYTRAVGGPVIDPGAPGLSVVPVAPFAIRSPVRVASAEEPLAIRVERDEGAVTLLVDGEDRRRVPPGRPVTVAVGDAVDTVRPPGRSAAP